MEPNTGAPAIRSEQEIFHDLAQLCAAPGYVHAIAHLSFRDNVVAYRGRMKPEDMEHLFSEKRIIWTELSTLRGLLIQNEIDFRVPPYATLQTYVEKTETLLEELHRSMSAPVFAEILSGKYPKDFNPLTSGSALREPIFYGGESAYSFQYRDFALKKYSRDDAWLLTNKGFPIAIARDVVCAVARVQDDRLGAAWKVLKKAPEGEQALLPAFLFSVGEVARKAGIDTASVRGVLRAFTLPSGERNKGFQELHDFNLANAFPLLEIGEDEFLLFHIYSLVEALYESPFYWMCADRGYLNTAMKHRGLFTEEICRERLEIVFGANNVHSNVSIFESPGKILGEVDVLVVWGNRAIVLQAKSKRLTLESRKGNDGQIKTDFKKAIQDAYDQGLACARLLLTPKIKLRSGVSAQVVLKTRLKEVYILCVVADHYPALAFQSRQFLKYETTDAIRPPFILDVFALDAITEMLQSPLRLLSYVHQRTLYTEKLLATHELTILSYHLKRNLWLDDEYGQVMLSDDISADLDIAMVARRDGVPGKRTPDGILTRFSSTSLGRLAEQIEAHPDPATIDLGFLLLTLGEDTVFDVSKGIDAITDQARRDRAHHDLTVGIGGGGTGLTIHCNEDALRVAGPRLEAHCHSRKYTQRASSWFGVCISPDQELRFGVNLGFAWQWDAKMEHLTKDMEQPLKIAEGLSLLQKAKTKVGRNDACPCGSGIKYKKCCLGRPNQ